MWRKSLTDGELVTLLKDGDDLAFTEIYNRYWKKLFLAAGNKLGDLDEAEELVQQIFVSLWDRRAVLDLRGELAPYLAVSVKYRVLKVLSRRHYRREFEHALPELLDDSTQEWLQFEELRSRMEELVAALPEKCRLVYQLSRNEGYSQKQIAAELDIAEKTVEAHIGKALRLIRKGLHVFLGALL